MKKSWGESFVFLLVLVFAISFASAGSIIRVMQPSANPGEEVTISLDVTVDAGEEFYAIEEFVPLGWNIVSYDGQGSNIPGSNRITWAVQNGAVSGAHIYTVNAGSSTGVFSGTYTLGSNVVNPIGGDTTVTVVGGCTDVDGDGYGVGDTTNCPNVQIDCNDNDNGVSPGLNEFCDGKDNDCDLTIDETGDDLCDDGIACTDDICATDGIVTGCIYPESLTYCDISNGLFCDGSETCSIQAYESQPRLSDAFGCIAGTPPSVSDTFSCTSDSCDESNDVIVNLPNDNLCSEFSNGATCDPDNFNNPEGCGFVGNCVDVDVDGLLDYDVNLCALGVDQCPDSDSNYFVDNPFELVNYVPDTTLFDNSDININNIFDKEGLTINSSGTLISFNENVELIRLNDVGCFEKLDFANIEFINIGQRNIFVNGTFHRGFNKPANLTFENINFVEPKIFRDGTGCTLCNITSYADGLLKFNVPGFSLYEAVEGYVAPPNPPNPPGGGGGGGGNPIILINLSYNGTIDLPEPLIGGECKEQWRCTDYAKCQNGKQVRGCLNANACGNERQPELERECVDATKDKSSFLSVGLVLLTVLVIIVIVIMFVGIRKGKNKSISSFSASTGGKFITTKDY